MWTPRRVLLLILGMALFGTAFGVYARFLGWIDGLPQLPEELLARRAVDETLPPATMTIIEHKLQLAFGQNCPEVDYWYKIELPSKGIVFAAHEYNIEPDGRLRFSPFSLATLKEKTPGSHPEINTVHADIAFLEFDKPVKVVTEIGSRRIVACELVSDPGLQSRDARRGRVHILNNRGTAAADDDLTLVTPGPVSYRESPQADLPLDKARPQLWTGAAVQLEDRRNRPQATTITAQGMQIYLAVESPAAPAANQPKPKARGSSISGVRRVVLPANVDMNLWMDPGSGFLSAGAAKPQAAAKPGEKPAERTNVLIHSDGPFTYDVGETADRARFDRLPPGTTQLPNFVRVIRPQSRGPGSIVNDQLDCDTLELQFAHKPKDEPAKSGAPAPAKKGDDIDRATVEWIHAWGDLIVLTSDEEKLEARGNDLFHDAKTKATVLKGSPEMVAVKDGNEIHAPELVLYGAGAKDGQQAHARGAGYVKLYDRTGTQRAIEARWLESLHFRKDDGKDLLTLTGQATFDDKEHAQWLQADVLKLLLVPESKAAKPGDKAAGRPKPQKLDALGHVVARSPDLMIDDTETLVLLFRDKPPPPAPAAQPQTPAGKASPSGAPAPAPAAVATKPLPPKPAEPAKKPIQLRAKRVQAFVDVGADNKQDLDTVHCEEEVRVHQDPPTPQEKPVDMRGQKITLEHKAAGNLLKVTGTLASPSEVHFPELSLLGPYIEIDQLENSAKVNGTGSMRMASTTGMNGEKLKQPTDLVVTWKQEMRFNGQHALFFGHVQAQQDATNVLCNNMQVTLTRPVSLNRQPGDAKTAGKEPANVERVVCDSSEQKVPQPVSITETVRDDRGKLIKFQQIESNAVVMNKEDGILDAGPGEVRLLQLGPKDEALGPTGGPQPAKKPEPGKPVEEEPKLTWIQYSRSMKIDNTKRTAKFYGTVEVLHFPSDDQGHNLVFGKLVDKLPVGGMYLRCEDKLVVYSARDANGKVYQQMEAEGKAYAAMQDVSCFANTIKYDESKQQVIFEGSEGNLAMLYRFRVKGGKPETMKGTKIIYNRLTGSASMDGGQVISAGQ